MSVNSFISNSDFATAEHRSYVRLLLLLIGVAIAPLWLLWFDLEPLAGDVTRLGWYAERDFGWRAPQYYFTHPLSDYATSYDRYHDVVVVGDSFSKEPSGDPPRHPNHWHNFLADMTGWSVLVLRHAEAPLPELLSRPAFVSSPPKILIYERAERYMDQWLPRLQGGECNDRDAQPPEPLPRLVPRRAPRTIIERPKPTLDVNFGYVRRYLIHEALREGFGMDNGLVFKLGLTTPSLFSSAEGRQLLVYKDEFRKAHWKPDALDGLPCRLSRLKTLVEANGKTRLLVLIAPDKLTAYGRYVLQRQYASLSRLEHFLDVNQLPAPRIDQRLSSAIAKGEVDIYLPDNTHWGYRGHEIVAETVLDYLMSQQTR